MTRFDYGIGKFRPKYQRLVALGTRRLDSLSYT